MKTWKNNSNFEGAILPTVELSLRSHLMLRYKYICVEYMDSSTDQLPGKASYIVTWTRYYTITGWRDEINVAFH